MSYWSDAEFQTKVLSFLVQDRKFLREAVGSGLNEKDFKPKRGDSSEVFDIAKVAIDWWDKYNDPIGGMLRTEMLDFCRDPKNKVGTKQKRKILDLVEKVKSNGSLVAVDILLKKVTDYKKRRAKEHAVSSLIESAKKGELTDEKFQSIVNDAMKKFSTTYEARDYFSKKELKKRLLRRSDKTQKKYPYLGIERIDVAIRTTPRKTVNMVLARQKVGKTTAMLFLAKTFAAQGYDVLFFPLEEPIEAMEDKLDAAVSEVSIKNVYLKPNRVRRRFLRNKKIIKGRIKFIPPDEEGMTVAKMESVWERERARGFTADIVMIDHDDEIVPPTKYREGNRRFEFKDIFVGLRRFATRKDIWVWVAAQAKRLAEEMEDIRPEVVTAERASEDIGKARRVALCLGIGMGNTKAHGPDCRHIYIAAHRYDRSLIGFNVVGNFGKGIFYDPVLTAREFPPKQKHRTATAGHSV